MAELLDELGNLLIAPENNYNIDNVYKVHVFDPNGNVTKIYIFCAKTQNEANLKELFSDIELALHKINNVEYIFSDQLIHPDDSIRVLKKKIIAEIGIDSIAYEELYLFGFMKTRIDIKDIYQKITKNETVEISKEQFQQIAININANIGSVKNIDFEKDNYSYDDFLELQNGSDGNIFVNKPIGIEFHNYYDFLFSANPFHIHSLAANNYEMDPKNQLLTFENQLLLNFGRIDSNNIYVCVAKTMFEYANRVGISQEYVCEIYYPLLFNKDILGHSDLMEQQGDLIKETFKSLTPATMKFYKGIDIFHEISSNKPEELGYMERGISRYFVTMRSSDFDHPFPLDVLFKNIHSTKEMPFIKFNPGARRENMYRFYSDKIARNGKKIPFLPESVIMKLSKEIGKSHQLAIYVKKTYKTREYNMLVSFDANSKIQVKGELSPPLPVNDLEEFIGVTLNPIIVMVRGYLYSSGYALHSFQNFQDETIEKFNFKYSATLSFDKKVDLNKYKGCISGIFDVLSDDVTKDTGAQLR
jgi:hypothetical protein